VEDMPRTTNLTTAGWRRQDQRCVFQGTEKHGAYNENIGSERNQDQISWCHGGDSPDDQRGHGNMIVNGPDS